MREVLTPVERLVRDRSRAYDLLRFRSNGTNFANAGNPVRYPVNGNNLYFNRIDGPGVIQVRLGAKPNTWISVSEGMAIRREYDVVYFRDAHKYYNEQLTSVEAYSTYGTFIERPFKTHGSKGPPRCFRGTATIDTQPIHAFVTDFATDGGFGAFLGGFVHIKNTDAGNTLIIGDASPAVGHLAPPYGYPLSPGESISFDVDGRISNNLEALNAQRATDLCIWVEAGTCSFAFILDATRRDRSDVYFAGNATSPKLSLED